jgi:hypothetical protein
MASNDRMINDNELERMRKEAVAVFAWSKTSSKRAKIRAENINQNVTTVKQKC